VFNYSHAYYGTARPCNGELEAKATQARASSLTNFTTVLCSISLAHIIAARQKTAPAPRKYVGSQYLGLQSSFHPPFFHFTPRTTKLRRSTICGRYAYPGWICQPNISTLRVPQFEPFGDRLCRQLPLHWPHGNRILLPCHGSILNVGTRKATVSGCTNLAT